MECRTKTGLLLLMVSVIITIISTVLIYGFMFSFNPENITSGNFINMLAIIIPAAIIGLIGGLITLIGAIFMLLGRKEFGEKHQKFMFYAIVVFVISIVVTVVLTMVTMFMTFSSVAQTSFTYGFTNTTSMMDTYQNSNLLTITAITALISAILGGLIWLFGLYHLENKTGRMILFVAYISMVATAVIVAISSMMFYEDFISSANFEGILNSGSYDSSSYSQLTSLSQWIGTTGLISLVGNAVSNMLLLIALYIPFKRITSGDIIPTVAETSSSEPDRRCPNCGQAIPFDANICPYCSKRFEDYL